MFGSAMESQVAMAQRALDLAAMRNNNAPPAPQPSSCTTVEPCAQAVSIPRPDVGGNPGGKQ
jgi:hypothetical protein